ncbi:hypothetical protein [Phycicoccus sp. Soil802]|uniref:hypothetical protein n=1 Tax=Phycicoccus sp. Soil802 TaxID=1736414 RepID=UPI0007024610|nr:hypothetical protein [Phycicoccus sp. Soil802]KRF27978.1 hypothetical protein ASG91_10880 [Phycicoccus sp. Soil802]
MHSSTATSRRAGLGILGLLSLADCSMLLLTDGNTPPYSVAALVTALGLISLALVIRAFRDGSRPIRLLVGLRALSAVAALPAFLVDDVPATAQAAAAATVVLTVMGILLIGRTDARIVTS